MPLGVFSDHVRLPELPVAGKAARVCDRDDLYDLYDLYAGLLQSSSAAQARDDPAANLAPRGAVFPEGQCDPPPPPCADPVTA